LFPRAQGVREARPRTAADDAADDAAAATGGARGAGAGASSVDNTPHAQQAPHEHVVYVERCVRSQLRDCRAYLSAVST
jgi:hypothetical protein